MVDLLQQHLVPVERRLQFSFLPLPLNRCTEDIRGALQECDVILAELAFRATVHFKHPERRPVACQDDVDGKADTVLHEPGRQGRLRR